MKTTKTDIGIRIHDARKKLHYLQKEVGDIVGCGKQAICSYEKGVAYPNPETLAKIASALNVTLDWLITGKNSQETKHSDPALESAVKEHAAGWECKGEEFSETEQRIIGMLRRLTTEMRQVHFDGITTSYFNQMEREIEAREKKD